MSDTYAIPPTGKLPIPVGIMGLYIYNGQNYVPISTVNQNAFSRDPKLFLVTQFKPLADGLTAVVIDNSIDIQIIFDAFQKPLVNPQLINGSRTMEFSSDYPGSTSLWMIPITPPSGAHVSNEILLAPAPTDLGEHFVDGVLTDKVSGAQSKQRFEYIVVATGGQIPVS